ncbi:hypothetical protein BN1263230022 [Stenotrophomonas thermophila]|nr:hypothetical protein BN1263230022 [Stenotrophomonas maltophilia]
MLWSCPAQIFERTHADEEQEARRILSAPIELKKS